MGDSRGRVGILFVVIMALSAAAAVPLFNNQARPTADDVAVLPEGPEEAGKEGESRPQPVAIPKPKARSIRTAKWTGGETESTNSSKPRPAATRPMAVPAWGGGNPRPKTVTEIRGYRDADGRVTFTARQNQK